MYFMTNSSEYNQNINNIISSLNVMNSQKSHLAQQATNDFFFHFLLHLLNLQDKTPSVGAKAQQVLRREANMVL